METFLSLTFFSSSSRQMKKRSMSTLSCFVDVWFFSLLRFSASLMCNFCGRLISLRNYLLRLMSAQFVSLTAFKTLDVFAQLLLRLMSAQLMSLTTSTSIDTIARKVQSHSRNMPDDNELRFFLRWARPIFRDERGYSHKEELRFQWRKTDLIETEKHGRLLKVLGNCAFHVVLESYAVQAWGLLWCFYSDGLSEQLITPIRAFQFDNSSFLHASFSTRALGAVFYNILAQKKNGWVQASVRQKFPSHRACIFHSTFAMLR